MTVSRYIVLLLATGCLCQDRAPIFTHDMDKLVLPENTELNQLVYILKGFDPDDNSTITFGLESQWFAVPEPSNGYVYLIVPLDRESLNEQNIKVDVWISDGVNKVTHTVTVIVEDVNDEKPQFTLDFYKANIPEDAVPPVTVIKDINVRDQDMTNEYITVTCSPPQDKPQFSDVCNIFEVKMRNYSNTHWVGDIILQQTLNFEQQSIYQLMLTASDGVNIQEKSVEIELVDVNDVPPIITSSTSAIVSEDITVGKPILTISAKDGDSEVRRDIRYSLTKNPGSFFEIDQVSGKIMAIQPLDKESEELKDGFIILEVKACEMFNASFVATDDKSCTSASVTITVNDKNDNPPLISVSSPQTEIPEDLGNGKNLPISITVSDSDQGINSEFEVYLDNYQDYFKVTPNKGTGRLTTFITVDLKNGVELDFESGIKVFVLEIVAKETKTNNPLSRRAKVTVSLTDVNDNAPVFPNAPPGGYVLNVSEEARSRTPVGRFTATDADSGKYGDAGIRYRLFGNCADRFRVDARSGQITVRGCVTPGRGNCLDFEQSQVCFLTFQAGDNYGEGLYTDVPITVNIIDTNDNKPKFTLPSYVSYVMENKTELEPPLAVQATDADSSRNGNNKIEYAIVGGDSPQLWQIRRDTGEFTARSGIPYPTPSGKYVLSVTASDPKHSVTTTVTIYVIDANDNPPIFDPLLYEETILESTTPNSLVTTVYAKDADPATDNNGKIRYRILSGSQDKFEIDPERGVITVAPGAKFDYDLVKRYDMKVVAEDQGQPQLTGTADVIVHITDANNKNPYFSPSTIRRQVLENEAKDFIVTQLEAKDPDTGASLIYYFEDPRYAWDPQNNTVSPTDIDYKNLFSIERTTGIVRVNKSLDRDIVARVLFTVKVVDNASNEPGQSAVATLIIDILEVNTKPPIFGLPWRPDYPFIDIISQEAQGNGSYVTTLIATDTDPIHEYRLISNPNDHFDIHPKTGVVTINNPLDYDSPCDRSCQGQACDLQACETLQVVAVAVDNGLPKLTSTATINIKIENVNDEHPNFYDPTNPNEPVTIYEVSIPENSPGGTTVVQVEGRDQDKGDFGNIRYRLEDPTSRFVIDDRTGLITVVDGAELDRETEPVSTLQVTVSDSPLNPDVRKETSITVYITLTDMNDNPPELDKTYYNKQILENVPPGTSVIQLDAFDKDEGDNAIVHYFIEDSDPQGFFVVDRDTGLVTTNTTLTGFSGTYNLTIGVRDPTTTSLVSYGYLTINVLKANNGAPIWIIPKDSNSTVEVLENQYVGMEIFQVSAKDDKDIVTYGFEYNGEFVRETPEFEINPFTGMITANIIFDREKQDTYTLLLVARDSGEPQPFEAKTYVTVKVLDTDDHDPEFPQYFNCCTIPYKLLVSEAEPLDTYLGEVTAQDKDIGENANIRYIIRRGNDQNTFRIEPSTGKLYLNKLLDHETQSRYTITIEAQDSEKLAARNTDLRCRCHDPSLVLVNIHVVDRNDFPPKFDKDIFTACVPRDAQPGRQVTTISAIDPDTGLAEGFTYAITNLVNYNTASQTTIIRAKPNSFVIGATNGSVHTNTLMKNYENHYFIMQVQAVDEQKLTSYAELRVWVTAPSQIVKLTFRSPKQQIENDLDQILEMISAKTNKGIVCVEDLRTHVSVEGVVNNDWTDLVLHVIDGNGLYVLNGDKAAAIINSDDALSAAFGMAAVTQGYGAWVGFETWPVLVAILVIALLILLGLLLLLLFCCCCPAGLAAVPVEEEEYYAVKEPVVFADTINPLWKLKLNEYEDQELAMAVKEGEEGGFVNQAFVGETTMANGYAAHMEASTNQQLSLETKIEDTIDSAIVDSEDVRIEAALETKAEDTVDAPPPAPLAVEVGTTAFGSYEATLGSPKPDMINEATMTDSDRAQLSRSMDYLASVPPPAGPSKIGATLTSQRRYQSNVRRPYESQQVTMQVIGDTYSDYGGYRDRGMSTLSAPAYTLPRNQPISVDTRMSNNTYDYVDFPNGRSRGPSFGSHQDVFGEEMYSSPVSSVPVWNDDFPEGIYQGEIHLGTLERSQQPRRYERHETHEFEEGYIPPTDEGTTVFTYTR